MIEVIVGALIFAFGTLFGAALARMDKKDESHDG